MKKINQQYIMKVVFEKKAIPRAKIAEITGLSKATVSNNVKQLLENNLLKETTTGESSGGRRPVLLQLNSDGAHFVGFEWGIDQIKGVLINLNKKIVKYKEINVDNYQVKNYIEKTAPIIEEFGQLIDKKSLIYGIGIGIHGLVNPVKGVSLYAPHFNWKNVSIVDKLSEIVDFPVFIDNDVRMMALAEKWDGKSNFVFINTGSGIGAAIVYNDKLLFGSNYSAGEFGHMKVVDDGPRCSCGNYGCLEALISTDNMVKNFESVLAAEVTEAELLTGWHRLKADARKVKDSRARKIIKKAAAYLGIGIANLTNLLNTDQVIIGGKFLEIEEVIMPVIKEKAHSNSLKVPGDNITITKTSFGDKVGAVGAAMKVFSEFFKLKEV